MRELETVCPDCNGQGKVMRYRVTEKSRIPVCVPGAEYADVYRMEHVGLTCSLCDGKGRILTDEGAELLGFIRRWVEPITLDVLQDAFRRQARSGGGL